MGQNGFNPFFIRASVYCNSSVAAGKLEKRRFNPFFIRASVYWTSAGSTPCWTRWAFQSLLHQGISLLISAARPSPTGTAWVSIPSSSGHQFTGRTSSARSGPWRTSFNPFFIRASVYWYAAPTPNAVRHGPVSIPSSSGHQFTENPIFYSLRRFCKFQSLLHQGISLLAVAGPIQAGYRRRFQSLLHQGISLLCPEIDRYSRYSHVSFNPFFIRASVYCALKDVIADHVTQLFQSLLHQGISLLSASFWTMGESLCVQFQSLLHQGISLLLNSLFFDAEGRIRFQSLLHQGISLLGTTYVAR